MLKVAFVSVNKWQCPEHKAIFLFTSPNIRIKVTEMRTAPHASSKASRKIGSAW
jgi:hypothetical protein